MSTELFKVNARDIFADFFDVHDVLEGFFNKRSLSSTVERTTSDDKQLVHEVDLPGVSPADVTVTVTGRRLDIVAKRKSGDFKRSYTLSEGFDPASCRAKLEHGVLSVTFPARSLQKQEPRQIVIDS